MARRHRHSWRERSLALGATRFSESAPNSPFLLVPLAGERLVMAQQQAQPPPFKFVQPFQFFFNEGPSVSSHDARQVRFLEQAERDNSRKGVIFFCVFFFFFFFFFHFFFSFSCLAKSPNPVTRRKQGKANKTEVHRLDPSAWLGTLVLGLWDNTCGPRIDQVWLGTPEPAHDDELLSYAVRLTLASEIGHQNSSLTQKFHLFSELDVMIISTSFGVFEGTSKYALIVLCQSSHLPRYLQLADVVQDRMFRLATGIQQLLERQLPAAAHVPHLRRFVAQIDALFLAPQPPLHSSFPPPASALLESGFFALALTAHIQAGCRSAVCGAPEAAVAVLHALQPFCLAYQVPLQRLSVAPAHVPDLVLQGVLLTPSMSSISVASPASPDLPSGGPGPVSPPLSSASVSSPPPLDDAALFQAIRPSAVCVLDGVNAPRVFAAAAAPEYAVLRREHVAAEIARLSSGASAPPPSYT
jgi:hypothetical protein